MLVSMLLFVQWSYGKRDYVEFIIYINRQGDSKKEAENSFHEISILIKSRQFNIVILPPDLRTPVINSLRLTFSGVHQFVK